MYKYLIISILLISTFGFISCETEDDSKLIEKENKTFDEFILNNQPDSVADGVYRIFRKTGLGATAKKDSKIKLIYIGKALTKATELDKQKAFDKVTDRDNPFEFTLGNNQVIAGWEKGIEGLRPGDKVELIIHSKMAYGDVRNGSISPYTSLWFDIEIINVE